PRKRSPTPTPPSTTPLPKRTPRWTTPPTPPARLPPTPPTRWRTPPATPRKPCASNHRANASPGRPAMCGPFVWSLLEAAQLCSCSFPRSRGKAGMGACAKRASGSGGDHVSSFHPLARHADMTVLDTRLDPRSQEFLDNAGYHRALVEELDRRL